MAHIIVVDDTEDICSLLKMALEKDHHKVTIARSASDLSIPLCQSADLMLLDIMLPHEDGFSICRRIRSQTDCPILFLTAKNGNDDVLNGLSIGGDDYITKPFNLAQLRARIAAHLRREQRAPVRRMYRGAFSFDLAGKMLFCGNEQVPLTKSEYAICETLARHAGFVYSREQLLEAVFGCGSDSDTAAITEHVKNLRSKLAVFDWAPIETVWGIGYKWKSEKE